tara:strand:+ start:4352 stop:6772 length:2421 start_codon:yes stop_codon:yes gene_type:complete
MVGNNDLHIINTKLTLSSLMEQYDVKYKWIHYTTKENLKGENEKVNICGRKHNWTKEECKKSANWLGEENNETRYCVREYDIYNTPLGIFDDDKPGRTIEESLEEYPFLKGCYATEGNTKGFHFITENQEFVNASDAINTEDKRDFISRCIWSKSNKILCGNSIYKMDVDKVKELVPKFKTSKEEVKKIIKLKTNDDCVEEVIKQMNNEFLEALLNNIDMEYCDDFKSWFNVVGALKAINEIDYIDYFSKRSSKYKSGDYNSIVSGIKGINYSVGTIYYYSKISNPKKHFEILDKFEKISIKSYDELGDTDYAEIFITISDDVFYHSTMECYYGYNSVKSIWEEKKKDFMLALTTDKLLDYLNKELRKVYYKLSTLEVCTNIDKNCNCEICSSKEKYKKQIKQIEKNIKSCKSASNTKHIIDYIFDKLKNNGKDILMDSNPYLFCWNNKTYDIKNRQFVKRDKYDYITTTTGYDHESPLTDYKGEINSLMGDIFSNKEVEKCFFSVCRSGLTGVLEEKFTLANGSGGNGKGLINFAMGLLLGNYFHDVSHSVITKEITGDKPLPEISKLNGVRYCVISEIKEDSLLLEDSIKKLTNPIINARGMYSSQTRVINTATYVAECNARPKIQGENGDAMSRRYIDVFFNKRYTSDPDKLELDGYLKANPLYKTKDYWIPRRIALFFWLLDFNDTIYEPPIVKARSKEFLKECNIPLMVFEDTIEKCEFDKTKNTLITSSQFLDIIRKSEEYKNLEKQEKKLYNKNKVIDFFRNTCFDNYKKKQNIGNSSCSNCITGYRIITDNDCEIDED